jgi:hypothetical protein
MPMRAFRKGLPGGIYAIFASAVSDASKAGVVTGTCPERLFDLV